MTTLSEQIDAKIKSLQEQLSSSMKEHKKERTIDERIADLKRQFREEEEEKEKKKRDETFSKEEKRLLSKIESKLSVIQFLSNAIESEEKDLKDLEEQLEVIRDCKNM